MVDKLISNVPRVAMFIGEQSFLTPLVGSLYAALQGMEEGWTYADVLALSGAGNRLRWMPGAWDPSNVDIRQAEEPASAAVWRALEAVGWKGEQRLTKELNGETGPLVDADTARREIVASLDRGIPVLAYGIIGPPECCVVFGYQNDGERLVGWNYFQTDSGFSAEEPFVKADWFEGLWGYVLLTEKTSVPPIEQSGLTVLRTITRHARQGEVRGAKVGLAAWDAMLAQLEHDDFSGCTLTFPQGVPGDDDTWQKSVQGRFFVYCDALCQVYERNNALPFYEKLAQAVPEWAGLLREAMQAWKGCSEYGGFLWKYVSMDEAGYEKFRDPAIRKILADEGWLAKAKDVEAVEKIETLLKTM